MPTVDQWTLISVFYSANTKHLKLWVNNHLQEQYNPQQGWDIAAIWQPIVLNNPRLGAWCDDLDTAEATRSLDGQMAMFRIWSSEVGGGESTASVPSLWNSVWNSC